MIIKDNVVTVDSLVSSVVGAVVLPALEEATFYSTGCFPRGDVSSGGLKGTEESPGQLSDKNKKENSFHAVSVQMGMFSAQAKRQPDSESLIGQLASVSFFLPSSPYTHCSISFGV